MTLVEAKQNKQNKVAVKTHVRNGSEQADRQRATEHKRIGHFVEGIAEQMDLLRVEPRIDDLQQGNSGIDGKNEVIHKGFLTPFL